STSSLLSTFSQITVGPTFPFLLPSLLVRQEHPTGPPNPWRRPSTLQSNLDPDQRFAQQAALGIEVAADRVDSNLAVDRDGVAGLHLDAAVQVGAGAPTAGGARSKVAR